MSKRPSRPIPAMTTADSSSDDEAPEEINVSSSRQQGMSQLKAIQEAERKSRIEEREKRRKRNEMFRMQKEKKLQDLSKRKLPEDVLAAVSGTLNKQIAQHSTGPVPPKNTKYNDGGDDEEKEEDEQDYSQRDCSDDRLSDSGVEEGGDSLGDDFISIGKSGCLALVTHEVLAKQKLSAAQRALNFKYSRLYNQSTIPRETTKQRRARMAKRKATQQR